MMTRRQLQIYETIRCFQGENGYSPTVEEIRAACGLGSKSTVHGELVALRDRGLVTWRARTFRTLQVVEGAY